MHFPFPIGAILKRGPIISKDQVEAHYRGMFGQTDWLGLFMSPDSPLDAKLYKLEDEQPAVVGVVELLVNQARDCLVLNKADYDIYPFNLFAMVNNSQLMLDNTAVHIGVDSCAVFQSLLEDIRNNRLPQDEGVPYLFRFCLRDLDTQVALRLETDLAVDNRTLVSHENGFYLLDGNKQVIAKVSKEKTDWLFCTFSLAEALAVVAVVKDHQQAKEDTAPAFFNLGNILRQEG